MKNYRNAFIAASVVAVALAAALGFAVWRYAWHRAPAGTAGPEPAAASPAPAESETTGAPAPNAPPAPATLAPLQLTPERLQSIGVTSAPVEIKPLWNEIRAAGNVAPDERLESYVQTRFSGWIQKVYADSTYQYVRKGQPLFTIYSPELVTTEQEYLLARQNRALLAKSTVPGVASGASSLLDSAVERLKQWEVPQREISRLESAGQVRHDLEIDSPASGYITERNALPNLYAQPSTRLYTITDLSTVWVLAEVFQSDMGEIRAGAPATVTTDAYPGRTFPGRVDFVYPEVDMTTRTAKVRLVLANPGLKLTPGMFVNVELKIPLGRRLAIPATGVFQTGTRNIVFVDHGGGYLEPRDVELGRGAGGEIAVQKGLKPGERVVTSANFLIDSESQLQAAIGSFVPPPPGAGAAASMNPAIAPQANLEFSTAPSPPAKGPNTVRVKLTSSGGSPVTGAEVTVTFFMPAMPAMGMSAMRAVIKLAEKGGGVYEGQGTLGSGGTWQVTIIARKSGQALAQKQMTVNAEGGM